MTDSFYVNIFLVLLFKPSSFSSKECDESCKNSLHQKSVYNKEDNELLNTIEKTLKEYIPCMHTNCSCYIDTISKDLSTFKSGITESMLNKAKSKGTTYKVIGGRVYRDVDCMFPSRCAGVEHYLRKLRAKLPDLQLVLNTRDWPQISRFQTPTLPVFSFSKTKDYLDILYPAWAFWEGGPAIKLYPRGLGHWNQHRQSLDRARERWPWREKQAVAFFRGSRTNSERDTLVMLSREKPELIDAAYTKNQAWKSDKDTLYAAPADEVSLEDHCRYKYLFNFRGVAASFRFKHLFLCNSLVFHVGDEWLEFFYPALQPWVHYVPVKSNASKNDLRKLLEFVKEHDDLAQHIAQRGRDFIWDHLRSKDVICYWKLLLKNYAKLLKFKPHLEGNEIEIV